MNGLYGSLPSLASEVQRVANAQQSSSQLSESGSRASMSASDSLSGLLPTPSMPPLGGARPRGF